MNEANEDIRYYISQLKFVNYVSKKIMRYNRKLMELKEEFYTVPSIDYSKIPSSGGTPHFNRLNSLLSKEQELIKKREKYEKQILELDRVFSKLPEDIQVMLIRLYILQENHEKVANDIGYSRQMMYKKVNESLKKFTQ